MWNKVVTFVSNHKVGLGIMLSAGILGAIGKVVMREEDKLFESVQEALNDGVSELPEIEEVAAPQDEVNL